MLVLILVLTISGFNRYTQLSSYFYLHNHYGGVKYGIQFYDIRKN